MLTVSATTCQRGHSKREIASRSPAHRVAGVAASPEAFYFPPSPIAPTGGRVVDSTEFERWRAEADAAKRGAGVQAAAELHNWACFLAEQAAQLAVKALLHGIGAAPWGHDLVALGRAMARATEERPPESVTAALQRLSRHYIPARYPDAHPAGSPLEHYGPADVRQALDDLSAILGYVDASWTALSSPIAESEHED